MDPYVGEIRTVAFNYAPKGWALCNGALLPISQNAALYSLLGNQFGGDGRSTFALPNLQGNIVVGAGQGPGLSQYVPGQFGGSQTVALISSQMPAHSHTIPTNATGAGVKSSDPSPSVFLGSGGRTGQGNFYVDPATGAGTSVGMMQNSASTVGGGQAHNNMAPYLTILYCIALVGVYPSRP